MKKSLPLFATIFIVIFGVSTAWFHCEIPCGIYDDQMRIHLVAEHIQTIEKSFETIQRTVL